MRSTLLSISAILAMGFAGAAAQAQDFKGQDLPPKIWDIELGTPIKALPLKDFVDPACGTNGGPPARVLKGFEEFAVCPVERATGLREVWFRYDDEMEYVARARRSGVLIITSLLIDDAGLVQGYRIVNDPRVEGATRIAAFGIADLFKGMAGMGIPCVDLPPAEGERPIDDIFVKEICESKTPEKVVRLESRHYYKPGQFAVDPNENRLTENLFESSARLEVYRPPAGAK